MIVGIAEERLANQGISHPRHRRVEDVVAWLGAVQAQEYVPAKWGLALRMRGGATSEEIERALDDGRNIRAHVMRPTWHFVPAADLRWMLEMIRATKCVAGDHTYWSVATGAPVARARGSVYLLPIYDEYTVAYRDLAAVPRPAASFGRLQQALVAGGELVGTWRAVPDTSRKKSLKLETAVSRRLTRAEQAALKKTLAQYETFLGMPVVDAYLRHSNA